MKISEFKKLIREEVGKVIREVAVPIAKADLIAKLEPLKKLFPKITDRDLRALTFVGNKAETTKTLNLYPMFTSLSEYKFEFLSETRTEVSVISKAEGKLSFSDKGRNLNTT
jgi:hypothetical protein